MIIVRLDGGLGNQMFQYAYGWYLAQKNGCELLLDPRSYEDQPQHGYLLDRFAIQARVAGPQELEWLPKRYRPKRDTLKRDSLSRCRPATPAEPYGWLAQLPSRLQNRMRRHKESRFGFHPRHLQVPSHRYLIGHWQSESFFPGVQAELIQQFQVVEPLSEPTRRIAEHMASRNSLAVHIRRGDYVTNPAAAKIYCPLSLDYYMAAIEDWASSQSRPEVFVFSNDLAWCRQHLQLPWPTTFVDHNSSATAHEDMLLISRARCCVIANSTFSWWAAWLNQHQDKMIYAPNSWFQPGTLDGSNLIPESWRRISTLQNSDIQARAA